MTREEAIKIIRKMLACTDLTVRANLNADMVSACNFAIKELEQEPILDKIEEEINSPNRGTCDYFIVDRIEEIINKYKAESEPQESEE